MRKVVLFTTLILVFCVSAIAQDETPRAEVFAGYSYLRANPGSPVEGVNLHGGSGSIAWNANNWFGAVADFGGYKASDISVLGSTVPVDATVFTYLFGPRISYRQNERVTPFVQALFGGARLSGSVFGISAPAANAFAMTVGGGFDVKVHKNVAIRPVQAEYMLTRFEDPASTTGATGTQNNARVSAGIVFRIGAK